ncbi:MAG: aldose 1-epimerase family protein, partial [Propionibacteriaceae bacterium]|nr:aldose 1-epimerase family protein [Propionibacteriaceae bacterium]
EPIDRVDEVVWRYDGLVTTDGYAQAAVTSPTGLAATLRWRAAELPLAYEWVFPPRGTWALGLEPANAPLWGPDRAGEDAGAPVLQPGEAFETALTIRCSLSTPDTSR